jgi:glycosyltransferase involved in cell wall biosynthesis
MSVHNGARYLQQAIDSILAQTFTDFEFIIVDDGSTDETSTILDGYSDSRIVRLHNSVNRGLTKSLNRGLKVAKGQYIARQDADDTSLPPRLARQVEFLDVHPQIDLVGTAYVRVYDNGKNQLAKMPLEHREIRDQLFYQHSFCHGSVMVRRIALEAVDGYDESFIVAQDHDLWLRLTEWGTLANLPDPLYYLRISSNSVTGRQKNRQRQEMYRSIEQALQRRCPPPPSSLALGRYYWQRALDELIQGNKKAASSYLEQARMSNELLDEDVEYLVRKSVHRAFDAGSFSLFQSKSTADICMGISILQTLFELMPLGAHRIRTQRRRALGELHAAYAFAAFDIENYITTLDQCWEAWSCHYSHWLNFGLWSIFRRAVSRLIMGKNQT